MPQLRIVRDDAELSLWAQEPVAELSHPDQLGGNFQLVVVVDADPVWVLRSQVLWFIAAFVAEVTLVSADGDRSGPSESLIAPIADHVVGRAEVGHEIHRVVLRE